MTSTATIERFVTSEDGTRIGYLRQGRGPGIVLVQGAMADAHAYSRLAADLAPSFSVYSADRRGRGLSPKPYQASHDIARDIEDIDAILAETGANYVFGLSSGAVITLEAARTLDRVEKAAVYEPPFYPDGISHGAVRRLNDDIEQGTLDAALLDSLLAAGTAPAGLRALPWSLAVLAARAVIAVDARLPKPHATFRELLPGVRYDFNVVSGRDGKIDSYTTLDKPMLLLSGTKSPAFLRASIRALQNLLPQAQHIELKGLSHSGPWNPSRGGQPDVVADALSTFFS